MTVNELIGLLQEILEKNLSVGDMPVDLMIETDTSMGVAMQIQDPLLDVATTSHGVVLIGPERLDPDWVKV